MSFLEDLAFRKEEFQPGNLVRFDCGGRVGGRDFSTGAVSGNPFEGLLEVANVGVVREAIEDSAAEGKPVQNSPTGVLRSRRRGRVRGRDRGRGPSVRRRPREVASEGETFVIGVTVEAVDGSTVGVPGAMMEDEVHLLFTFCPEMPVGPAFGGGGVVVIELVGFIISVERVIYVPRVPGVCNFGFELDD